MRLKPCLAALLLTCSAMSYAVENYETARRLLPQITGRLQDPATLYCGCKLQFNESRSRYTPDLKSCGYQVRKDAKRAARVEAEHVMPAWEFGHQLQCWQAGGRQACRKNETFNEMEGDLHNLYPAVGEVNGDRSNYQYSQFTSDDTGLYGECSMNIDFKTRQAQPPERARGKAARAYLYMSTQYGIRLASQQLKLYEAWNEMYPPEADECKRNRLITKIQGNDNPYITAMCGEENEAPAKTGPWSGLSYDERLEQRKALIREFLLSAFDSAKDKVNRHTIINQYLDEEVRRYSERTAP